MTYIEIINCNIAQFDIQIMKEKNPYYEMFKNNYFGKEKRPKKRTFELRNTLERLCKKNLKNEKSLGASKPTQI